MKTTRDFLVTKLHSGKNTEPKYLCRCCGARVLVTKEEHFYNHWRSEEITRYECKCEPWNNIISAKKELDDLNKEFKKQSSEYIKKYEKIQDNIRREYDVDLNEHVWRYKLDSSKIGRKK